MTLHLGGDFLAERLLPTGERAVLKKMLFTVGLLVGVNGIQHRTRYCYPDMRSALAAWDGRGNPPGLWIKQKDAGQERSNPAFKGIPIEGR